MSIITSASATSIAPASATISVTSSATVTITVSTTSAVISSSASTTVTPTAVSAVSIAATTASTTTRFRELNFDFLSINGSSIQLINGSFCVTVIIHCNKSIAFTSVVDIVYTPTFAKF